LLQRLFGIYLTLFHLNAITALTMEEAEQVAFLEMSAHTFCNMTADTRHEESEKLLYLSSLKADKNVHFEKSAKRWLITALGITRECLSDNINVSSPHR
jgi:hypothetical protein